MGDPEDSTRTKIVSAQPQQELQSGHSSGQSICVYRTAFFTVLVWPCGLMGCLRVAQCAWETDHCEKIDQDRGCDRWCVRSFVAYFILARRLFHRQTFKDICARADPIP